MRPEPAAGRPLRLLTLGHSYCVTLNRRLAAEMARVGGEAWRVTCVGPRSFHGDLRPLRLTAEPGAAYDLLPVGARWTRSPHLFLYRRALRRILARGWDLVHCWEEPFVLAASQVARWCPPGASLVPVTAQNLAKRYPPPFAHLERFVLRRAAGWIAFGETVASTLGDRPGYAALPRRVIPMGVDVDLFRPDRERRERVRRELGWEEPGPPVVGFLGRFVPEKGLPVLLAALERTAARWRLLLVGGGPLAAQLGRWAAGRGGVRIVPAVAHERVPELLNAMDLLAAPSRTTPRWREQFGRMLVEAFACGVAVVASDSGEIPRVVGDAGAVVAEGDVAVWARTFERLLDRPDERRELARRGRRRAEERFAWPVVARRHLDFFAELVEGRSGRREAVP